jgi:lactate dehydrogenase-like 2-hydroxyacid dehydrogenase
MPPPPEVLAAQLAGCTGLLSLVTDRVDDALLVAAGPQLRVVSQMAVGVDNIDLDACTAHGIPVGHTPGVLTETTADLAWALLLAAARRVVAGDRFVRSGDWKTFDPLLMLGMDLHGATLGCVGFGQIGQAVARRAHAFGMRVLYAQPRTVASAEAGAAQHVPVATLLRESDFITLHTPLNPQTRHMIGAPQFALMKRSAILINTARGPIVDPQALYAALHNGQIAHAALDVTDPEPILMDSPLLQLDNLTITPHVGSATLQTRDRMALLAAENLLAGLAGARMPHCANPQVYASA